MGQAVGVIGWRIRDEAEVFGFGVDLQVVMFEVERTAGEERETTQDDDDCFSE